MSEIETVKIETTISNTNIKKKYGVLMGNKVVSYKEIVSTSFSNTSANFSIDPSSGVLIDPYIVISQPVKFTITGTTPNPLQNLYQSGFIAPRAFPISSTCSVLSVKMNSSSETIAISDVIDIFQRYNNDQFMSEIVYSGTPTYRDQSQLYPELSSTNRNCLGSIFDSSLHGTMRGAFGDMKLISNTPTEAVLEARFVEPLFISPLNSFADAQQGLSNLTSFNVQLTYTNLQYMLSHSNADGSDITNIDVELLQPSLFIREVTPLLAIDETEPDIVQYPYFFVQYNNQSNSSPILANQTKVISFNSQKLEAIPNRVYIACRVPKRDRGVDETDSFLSIESVNITFLGTNGILASASKFDLFNINQRNGSNQGYPEWAGLESFNASGNSSENISRVGGPLSLDFGVDVGLTEGMSPGVRGVFNFSYQLNVKNLRNVDLEVEVVAVFIYEGVWTIDKGRISSTTGPLSRQDVLETQGEEGIDASLLKGSGRLSKQMIGGDFFEDFSKTIGDIGEVVLQILPFLLPLLGLGDETEEDKKEREKKEKEGEALIKAGEALIAGRALIAGKKHGGTLIAGRETTRDKLRNRLKELRL